MLKETTLQECYSYTHMHTQIHSSYFWLFPSFFPVHIFILHITWRRASHSQSEWASERARERGQSRIPKKRERKCFSLSSHLLVSCLWSLSGWKTPWIGYKNVRSGKNSERRKKRENIIRYWKSIKSGRRTTTTTTATWHDWK